MTNSLKEAWVCPSKIQPQQPDKTWMNFKRVWALQNLQPLWDSQSHRKSFKSAYAV